MKNLPKKSKYLYIASITALLSAILGQSIAMLVSAFAFAVAGYIFSKDKE